MYHTPLNRPEHEKLPIDSTWQITKGWKQQLDKSRTVIHDRRY